MAYQKREGDGLLYEIGYTDDFGHDHTTFYGFLQPPPQEFYDSQEDALAKKARIRKITPGQKMKVFERDDFTCVHCGARKRLSVDHILPVSRGGTDDFDNLQTLCLPCNMAKGHR